MHPATYVTMLTCDLLSRRPDGEMEPTKEGGEGDGLKAHNQHSCVIEPGVGLCF